LDPRLTRIIGMDCEMVGVGFGGRDSILARVSLVNHFGHCVYDKFVRHRFYGSPFRPKTFGQIFVLKFWTKFHAKTAVAN
jgi:hypothetical protein